MAFAAVPLDDELPEDTVTVGPLFTTIVPFAVDVVSLVVTTDAMLVASVAPAVELTELAFTST